MVKKVYRVENLDCANCASKVEAALNALPEVQEAVLTYATMQLRITAEDPDALLPKLQEAAQKVEPEVEFYPRDGAHTHHSNTGEHEHHHDCCCGHEHHHDHDEDDDHDEHEHHHEHDHDDHEHHHHHHDGEECDDPACECHHHHHHADDVFSSWGKETPKLYSKAALDDILAKLDSGDYGRILRAKGIVNGEGGWLEFDYVPEEHEVRAGHPDYTGRLCVIGAELKEDKLAELFGL